MNMHQENTKEQKDKIQKEFKYNHEESETIT